MRRLFSWAFVPLLAALAAPPAAAVQLGRVQGLALIGRPLELSIPVTLEGNDATDACVTAEVFHGDTRVPPEHVQARLDAAANGRQGQLRIRSALALDEPSVTVYVRMGCALQTTRRYVLLSEFPGDSAGAVAGAAVPAVSIPLAVVPPAPAAPPATAQEPPATRRARGEVAARAGQAGATPPSRATLTRREAPFSVVRKPARAGDPRARARLRLEPLDLSIERDPTLKVSTELRTEPAANAQQRAEAAALWQAINARPEDILRSNQRVQTLETDVRGLKDLIQKNTEALGAMRSQVEKARSERNLLSLALLALAALALAGAALWFWSRRRAASRMQWWDGPASAVDSSRHEPDSRRAPAAPPPPAAAPRAPMPPTVPRDMPSSLVSIPDSTPPDSLMPSRGPQPGRLEHADFQHSQSVSTRMVKAEELIDIQQQADFFLSIGQHDQAIEVLDNHIHTGVETSALVWLDLLQIYHSLGRRADYDRLRSEFQSTFNAQVPPFEEYGAQSGGLELYGRALSRIVSLWPTRRALDAIEESIFRRPGLAGAEPFDLEAYRELVLLYNIAKDLVDASDSERGDGWEMSGWQSSHSSRFTATGVAQLPADDAPPSQHTLLSPSEVPWATPRLGLDIDLGEMEGDDEAQPQVEAPALEFKPSQLGADTEPLDEPPHDHADPPNTNMVDFDFDVMDRKKQEE